MPVMSHNQYIILILLGNQPLVPILLRSEDTLSISSAPDEDTSREARPNKGVRGQYDYESNNHFFLLKSIFLLMLLPNERK